MQGWHWCDSRVRMPWSLYSMLYHICKAPAGEGTVSLPPGQICGSQIRGFFSAKPRSLGAFLLPGWLGKWEEGEGVEFISLSLLIIRCDIFLHARYISYIHIQTVILITLIKRYRLKYPKLNSLSPIPINKSTNETYKQTTALYISDTKRLYNQPVPLSTDNLWTTYEDIVLLINYANY